jgi:serine/threonine protein phosphatase PrpC
VRYDHACRAIIGGRTEQEDMAAFWPDPRGECAIAPVSPALPEGELVAVLADGMGGHVAGGIASEVACRAFLEAMTRGPGHAMARLAVALQAGNDAIAEAIVVDRRLRGMGTTLVGLLVRAGGLDWISVGDSPLYLWRRGGLVQINEDHSLAPMLDRLVEEGRMTAEQAMADGRRHMLRSVLLGEPIELVDSSHRPLALEVGDCVVLASDGLETLSDAEIGGIVGARRSAGAGGIAEALLAAVEARGVRHQDNTTVVIVTVEG